MGLNKETHMSQLLMGATVAQHKKMLENFDRTFSESAERNGQRPVIKTFDDITREFSELRAKTLAKIEAEKVEPNEIKHTSWDPDGQVRAKLESDYLYCRCCVEGLGVWWRSVFVCDDQYRCSHCINVRMAEPMPFFDEAPTITIDLNDAMKIRDKKADDRRPYTHLTRPGDAQNQRRYLAMRHIDSHRANKNTQPAFVRRMWADIVRVRETDEHVERSDGKPWYDKV